MKTKKKAPNDLELGIIRTLLRREKSRAGESPWQKAISRVACLALLLVGATTVSAAPATDPLRVHPTNPRYFTDGTKNSDGSLKAVYLTGSHTWANLMDRGAKDPPPLFDFDNYLKLLEEHDHNFIRLWRHEHSVTEDTLFPLPYRRMGPGSGLDGKPKYDLNEFNPDFFDRLRKRVIAAGARGIYVGILFFKSDLGRGDWKGHPYNPANNVNGINGDPDGDGAGWETHTLKVSDVTRLQEAYVRRVVDTVNDLDNVLYEMQMKLTSPAPSGSTT